MGGSPSVSQRQLVTEDPLASCPYFSEEELEGMKLLGLGDSELLKLVDMFGTFSPSLEDQTVSLYNVLDRLGLERNVVAAKLYDVLDISVDHKLTFHCVSITCFKLVFGSF
jgi:hypothetical protein